ncbi:MAG: tRNA (N6-threonylcarbamoyladenosine(37)-N6)-methyltransferase TrmO [Acidobacteria bacterium]|nr:tRNA (N6-threonylcarbamoyladenosine(37)-N6)-methyltransferase TrmO [Acidobacteriota bacterium]
MAEPTEFRLRPIGYVRSAVGERKSMPPLGTIADVELLPEFAAGLLRIEKHSHLWVMAWLDQAEREVLQVTPRGVSDRGPAGLHGVFAVRSPARPNPIGLTLTRILGLDGLRIRCERLDFLDGTPVIDLKPYFVTRDAALAANNAPIGRPLNREALRDALTLQAANFHGELCPDLALAVEAIERFRAEQLELAEPDAWEITVPLAWPCLVDAVMGMTRATPGKGNLHFAVGDEIVIHHGGGRWSYPLTRRQP